MQGLRSLSRSRQTVSQAAFWLTAFTVLNKLLSLAQQVMLGRVYGASADTDAFAIAQIVPLMIGGLIGGSLTLCLIPIFADRDRQPPGALSGLALILGAGLALLSATFCASAKPTMGFLGHGLDATTMALTVRLFAPLTSLILFVGLAGILTTSFHTQDRFVVPAAAVNVLYVGGIAGIMLRPVLGIDGLAWGLVAGGLAQAVILALFMGRDWLHRPAIDVRLAGAVARSFVPVFVGSAISTLYLVIDRSFATSFPTGYVAGFTFAGNLMTIPSQLVVLNLNSALFPSLVRSRTRSDEFSRLFVSALSWGSFLVLPAVLVLWAWSQPLVKLLFGSNHFGVEAVGLTSRILVAYTASAVGLALKDTASNALIALGSEQIPMLVGVASLAFSVLLKVIWLPRSGYTAIATSTGLASLLNAVVLLALLARRVPVPWQELWHRSLQKLLPCGLGMLAVVWPLRARAAAGGPASWVLPIAGGVAYAGLCLLLHVPEATFLWARVRMLGQRIGGCMGKRRDGSAGR